MLRRFKTANLQKNVSTYSVAIVCKTEDISAVTECLQVINPTYLETPILIIQEKRRLTQTSIKR